MTLDDAARILLNGTTGVNIAEVARQTGVSQQWIHRYLRSEGDQRTKGLENLNKVYLFIWRQLNAHLLLCDADRAAAPADVPAGLTPQKSESPCPSYVIDLSNPRTTTNAVDSKRPNESSGRSYAEHQRNRRVYRKRITTTKVNDSANRQPTADHNR